MKSIFVALLLTLASGSALASDYGLSQHAVYGGFGFSSGGFALGADYEYLGMREFGLGAYVRMHQKDDDAPGFAKGYTILGGFIRPHFNKKSWDLYVSPGFAIISIDDYRSPANDSTTMGPSLAIGLMYDLSGTAAIGIEEMRHWVWFDKDWRGVQGEIDVLTFKFRVSF